MIGDINFSIVRKDRTKDSSFCSFKELVFVLQILPLRESTTSDFDKRLTQVSSFFILVIRIQHIFCFLFIELFHLKYCISNVCFCRLYTVELLWIDIFARLSGTVKICKYCFNCPIFFLFYFVIKCYQVIFVLWLVVGKLQKLRVLRMLVIVYKHCFSFILFF